MKTNVAELPHMPLVSDWWLNDSPRPTTPARLHFPHLRSADRAAEFARLTGKLSLVGLAAIPLEVAYSTTRDLFTLLLLGASAAIAVTMVAAFLFFRRQSKEELSAAEKESEIDSAAGAIPVAVRFRYQGFEYGQDVGNAILVEGWLIFEGARSGFSLQNADACLARTQFREHVPVYRKIRIRHLQNDLVIEIGSPSYTKLQDLLRDWSRWPYEVVGTSVLPPLSPTTLTMCSLRRRRKLEAFPPAMAVINGLLISHVGAMTALVAVATLGLGAFSLDEWATSVSGKSKLTHLEHERRKLQGM